MSVCSIYPPFILRVVALVWKFAATVGLVDEGKALDKAIMMLWLYNGIKRIDLVTMPVSEIVAKAINYRKWHIRFIFINGKYTYNLPLFSMRFTNKTGFKNKGM